jgi:hypothetical protein
VNTISTLQLTEPTHDELVGIEIHGTPRTAHSDPDVVQYADSRQIAAEVVQPPSIWFTALNPVEECPMAPLQRRYSDRGKVDQDGGGEGLRSLMVPVFSRIPSKPCSKTTNCMILAAVAPLPRSVAPRNRLGVCEALAGLGRFSPLTVGSRRRSSDGRDEGYVG